MNITLDAKELRKALAQHAKVLTKTQKATRFSITSVKLSVEKYMLVTTSTDLTMFMTTKTAAITSDINNGVAFVELKALRKTIAAMKGNVTLALPEGTHNLSISNGDVRFEMRESTDANAFPTQSDFVEKFNSYYFTKSDYDEMIVKLVPTVERNAMRRLEFQSILFKQTDKNLQLMASDAHRVACITQERVSNEPHEWLVPVKVFDCFTPDKDVTVSFTEDECLFFTDSMTVQSLLQGTKFPDIESIIPMTFSRTVHIDRDTLAGLLKQMNIKHNSLDHDSKVQLVFGADGKTLNIITANALTTMTYKGNSGTFNPTFFGGYLLDGITACDKDVTLNLNEPERPVYIEEDKFYYLLMVSAGINPDEQ